MDYKSLIQDNKKEFDSLLEFAKSEIASIRTGRANTAMIEDVMVDYMGSKLKIKEVATITVPEPRVIFIQPWDKGAIPSIENGIRQTGGGLSPVSDNQGVRVTIPSLTEERRKEMVKLLGQKVESARVKSRQIREDIMKKVQQAVKDKTAREDDHRKAKEDIQKVMDEFNKKLDEVASKKENELMTS